MCLMLTMLTDVHGWMDGVDDGWCGFVDGVVGVDGVVVMMT